MARTTYELRTEKNQVPQGGWLAWHYSPGAPAFSIESGPTYAAFTTSGAAKRYLARVVGRSRITWEDADGDGMVFTAQVEVKN